MRKQIIAWMLAIVMCLMISVPSFADVASTSNATELNPDPYGLATMDLTDEDYGISVASSIQTVNNTVDFSNAYFRLRETYDGIEYMNNISVDSDGSVEYTIPLDHSVRTMGLYLTKNSIPAPGTYRMQFDYASDVSIDYSSVFILSTRKRDNVAAEQKSNGLTYTEVSGDLYSDVIIQIGSIDSLYIYANFDALGAGNVLGGKFSVNFTKTDEEPNYTTVGIGSDTSYEYQNDVSSSLSDISSSIGDMSESLDSAAESLEYISTSQNLIIQGIDNVIMHISDQLYAFWDQLYNLIHEPTYARLGEILDAIRNLDLEITVELDEVTNAISTMNSQLQEKLQTTTDQITGGYDNAAINQTNQELSQTLDDYAASEDQVMDQISEPIESFEFDNPVTQYLSTFLLFGNFMQDIFENSGGMADVINLSFLMGIALMVVGLYRFKGGN